MLTRQAQNSKLTNAFAILSTNISYNSQQSMLDINKVMETILPDLLNHVYGLSLTNLNTITHNHPAIDLGDEISGLAVQVTSDGSKQKMVETISKYKKYELDKKYNEIWFLIISNDTKCSFQRSGFDIKIKNMSDLAKDICELPPSKFDRIFSFCQRQFSQYFSDNEQSFLAPTIVASRDPAQSISNFMKANNIDVNDSYTNVTVEEIREDLIILKDELSKLNEDQRWFIYQVMSWTLKNHICTLKNQSWIERCVMPISVLESGKNFIEKEKLRLTVNSIDAHKLGGYDEDNRSVDADAFYVYFMNKGKFEEFDYFAGIAEFLKQDSDIDNKLKRIIVDCDFSFIN